MYRLRLRLTLILFCCVQLVHGQERALLLKTGPQAVPALSGALVDSFNRSLPRVAGRAYMVLQFDALPGADERKWLNSQGVELLQYVPEMAFTASVRMPVIKNALARGGVRGLWALRAEQKMDPLLLGSTPPSWAVKVTGTVNLLVRIPDAVSVPAAIAELQQRAFYITNRNWQAYHIIGVQASVARLRELALLPIVDYVQAEQPVQALNYNTRALSRANALYAPLAQGGRALKGEGVVLGIGDDAQVLLHADFNSRVLDRSQGPTINYHGYHTTATMAGAGIVNELYRGMAPKATIVSSFFSNILTNAATYRSDYGMVVTNNSYGNIAECSYMGLYDIYAQALDQQAFDIPDLTHVFAAGNSGDNTCAPFPQRYHTVYGGYQSAKNVVTVGATTDSGLISTFSSRGPVRDGRVKPEIVTQGQSVISAGAAFNYWSNSGTSMSAPAVAGGMGLLIQRYRQLNGGSNPKGALVKALLCNGAADAGTAGPDFNYGYGGMNLLRSVDMLEQTHYAYDSAAQGETRSKVLTVPANTAQLKVLLYWHDPAASLIASKTLVNDLDLEVLDLSNNTILPYRLDTSAGALGTAAFTGPDHINNVEQIVIDAPPAGNYTVRVKGTAITQNANQPYFLVWDPIPVSLQLTNPAGGEGWAPGDVVKLSWDAYGNAGGTYSLEYSTDNGSTWNSIATGLNAARRIYSWTVPNTPTGQAKVRITQSGTGLSATSNSFVIAALPVLTMAATANQCEGYINFSWTPVSGATEYEVLLLRGDDMVVQGTTTATSYVLGSLGRDTSYWVAVRPLINGAAGRRSVAVSRQPSTGSCTGTISDGDLKMNVISVPANGRLNTTTALGNAVTLTVQVKNLDDAAITGFDLKYSINGGAWVSEPVNASVGALGAYTYSFATKMNLSAAGTYAIRAVVKSWNSDPQAANDTLMAVVKQLANPVLTLPFLDDFETMDNVSYRLSQVGIDGDDHFDFFPSSTYARVRTYVNSGFAHSGVRAITLDMEVNNGTTTTNYLIGTFNLSLYNASTQDVRLGFVYRDHGQGSNAANKVWIRGSSSDSWIEVYDLVANSGGAGTENDVKSIELSRLLSAAGQNFSSSFQVRWGQYGSYPAVDLYGGNGFTFDDVRLYSAANDLQLAGILAPATSACGLTNATTITASLRNSSFTTLTDIPLRYRVDGGAWVSETYPSLAANTTVSFSFATKANLATLGSHTVQVIVDLPSDNTRDNDTATINLVNTPVIGSFPYLQNFETDAGYWYTGGKNASWEYGTPQSLKIGRAASGVKAWKTRLAGNYNDRELSYLYSPCFDVSGLSSPALSFSIALDLEDCGTSTCDAAWMEYSTDGTTWTKLGAYNGGTNWYNKNTSLWSKENYSTWRVASYALPTGSTSLRLRFVMSSDESTSREGIAIDDVHIYDDGGLFTGPTPGAPVQDSLYGNGWFHFSSGGKRIASINPNGQTLGKTDVQVYIDTTVSHYTSAQYYLGRNLTIKPTNRQLPGTDSVTVRLYFSERESELLINSTGCAPCAKPSTAYDLGVSKYTDNNLAQEDNSLANNSGGTWTFYGSAARTIVPYGAGYYAEFKVKDFSEFWFNSGGITQAPLPVRFLSFSARRNGADARLDWDVAAEESVLRYDVEVAEGDEALRRGQYVLIGSVAAQGNTTSGRHYFYTDARPGKTGTHYYRLRVRNADGSYQFSALRPVLFSDVYTWNVYPNPSEGVFHLALRAAAGENLRFRLFDMQGRLLREWIRPASGFVEKETVSLQGEASGAYLLQADGPAGTQSFRLYKK